MKFLIRVDCVYYISGQVLLFLFAMSSSAGISFEKRKRTDTSPTYIKIPLVSGEASVQERLSVGNLQQSTHMSMTTAVSAKTTDTMRSIFGEEALIRELTQNLIDACIRLLEFESEIKIITIPSPTGLPGSVIFLLNGNFAGSFVINIELLDAGYVVSLTFSNYGCRYFYITRLIHRFSRLFTFALHIFDVSHSSLDGDAFKEGSMKATESRLPRVKRFMGGCFGVGLKDAIKAALDDANGFFTDVTAVTRTQGVQYDGEDFCRTVRMYRLNHQNVDLHPLAKSSPCYNVNVSDHQGIEDIDGTIPLQATKEFFKTVDESSVPQANKRGRTSGASSETESIPVDRSTTFVLSKAYPDLPSAQRAAAKWQKAAAAHFVLHPSVESDFLSIGTTSFSLFKFV